MAGLMNLPRQIAWPTCRLSSNSGVHLPAITSLIQVYKFLRRTRMDFPLPDLSPG
jgi:hypothetical protein